MDRRTRKHVVESLLTAASLLSARHLYHGTSLPNAKSIMEGCLEPRTGDFVQEAYGEWPDLPELSFFADDTTLQSAVNGMIKAISVYLKKDAHSITEEDVRKHGALLVFEDTDLPQRPEDDDGSGPEEYPVTVEPGDYYSEDCLEPDRMIAGSALIRFLKRRGVAPTWGEEADKFNLDKDRTRLISLATEAHPDKSTEDIRDKVLKLSRLEVARLLRHYEA